MNKDELYTDNEAAKFLRCSVSWLRQMRVRGDGPLFAKIGRCVRYRLSDLQAWVEQNLKQNTLA